MKERALGTQTRCFQDAVILPHICLTSLAKQCTNCTKYPVRAMFVRAPRESQLLSRAP